MAGVRMYDPSKVVITADGVTLGGWADGTFVLVEREEDSFTKVTGADGQTSRAKSNNRSGTATLTFLQTSPSNEVLSVLLARDEREGNAVFPFQIKEVGTEKRLFAATAWVQKMPNVEYGKDINNMEWTLALADIAFNITGSAGVGVESST